MAADNGRQAPRARVKPTPASAGGSARPRRDAQQAHAPPQSGHQPNNEAPRSDSAGARVAVVDDDRAIRNSLRRALELEGYEVLEAADGAAGAQVAVGCDVMVLDATMPKLSGFELCRQLRADGSDLPILILTARHGTPDRVEGLDAGADDYLVKPFALDELLARLRALLRRAQPASTDEPSELELQQGQTFSFAGLTLCTTTREVTRAGQPLHLSRTEFALLQLFCENPRRVLSSDLIYREVWGYDASLASNSLQVYIGYLRKKTEACGQSRLIHTVRGVGYVLRQPQPDQQSAADSPDRL